MEVGSAGVPFSYDERHLKQRREEEERERMGRSMDGNGNGKKGMEE